MISPRLTWLIPVLLAAAPRLADACACCDAAAVQTPVAWSADGKKLLVTVSDRTHCQVFDYAMVLPVGAESASECRDLRADPKKAVPCAEEGALYDAMEDDTAKKPRPLADTGLTAAFPTAARPDKARFRVKKTRAPEALVEETAACVDNEGACFVFTVEVREGKAWRAIWSSVRVQGRKCPTGRKCEAMPNITVFPAPAGDTVAVRTFDFDAESMMFLTGLEWVGLGK